MASAFSNNGSNGINIIFHDTNGTRIGDWMHYTGPLPDVGDEVCVRTGGQRGRVINRTFYQHTVFLDLDV